ncbi:MAG TPA: LysE family transporter [Actinomycetota bacterium]|nr:LysE family transporter [Actinomycetota bacterium]
MALDLSHPAAAFGLGVALGTSPGPVQLLLLSEASRGGVGRGLRAMAGANLAFGAMLLLLAAGLSSVLPGEPFLRTVKVVGGTFLVWLALDALRGRGRPRQAQAGGGLHPAVRGAIAVVTNPGVYVFLASTGTAVAADAARDGGRPLALLTAAALLLGVSMMDSGMVIIGAGAHRASARVLDALGTVLALGLGALGVWLVAGGLLS